ncbi:MAG: hypothetical protein RLO01_20570 [Thalassobaculaceae bacterium]
MAMLLFAKATRQMLITDFARVMLERSRTVCRMQPCPASAHPNRIHGEQDDHKYGN